MRATPTDLKEVIVLEPDLFQDQRGWFMESYSHLKYAPLGVAVIFKQDNHSYSAKKGTVRGLHFQKAPMEQAKLVRCSRGSVRDVAVDIRKGSPTYCRWVAVELTAKNNRQLFIPSGFAHGFVTLEDDTEVQYKVDNYYSKEHDRVVRFDDPTIGVDWGTDRPILSDKDGKGPLLKDCDNDFSFIG